MADDIRTWWAPGRASLLGEHLDYNGGATLSCALNQGVRLKARLRTDHLVRAWTVFEGRHSTEFSLAVTPNDVSGWAAYIAGVVAGLAERGLDRGVDLVYESDLPAGAGLSSSGALTGVTALALNDLATLGLPPTDLAGVARDAEHDFAHAPTGLLDPTTILCASQGHLVHLDFAQETPGVSSIPARWEDDGLSLVVLDTRSRRSLGDGRYAERRAQCEKAREEAGLDQLAAIDLGGVVTLSDETLKARARHVFTEQTRVRAGVRALQDGDWPKFGTLLDASHASLTDDFEASSAPLDVTCEIAREAGALGAKLSGGGFAGSVVALIDSARIDALRTALESRFEPLGWDRPQVLRVRPAAGARELTPSPER